jgi:putative ATP-dependent endonuclease of the OLD family
MRGEYTVDYIKSLHIEGFKKFTSLDVEFNEHMNIIVGENEVGKSTILDAIKTVLNQQYRSSDKSILKELFNIQKVADFKKEPRIQNLPYILLELQLKIDPKHKNAEYFYGENNGGKGGSKQEQYGIVFECRFDEELGSGLDGDIMEGRIPYEYYTMRWTTFAGLTYQTIKRPLKFLAIDTSSNDTNTSFNYYNRTLFSSKYDENTRMSEYSVH